MVDPALVKEVRRLLTEGKLSQRKIAKVTGVSRGTVGAIAQGKRPDYDNRPRPWDEELERPEGPPQRCPTCGATVYLPCRLCRLRKLIAEGKTPSRHRTSEVVLGLDLKEKHHKRYLEVCKVSEDDEEDRWSP